MVWGRKRKVVLTLTPHAKKTEKTHLRRRFLIPEDSTRELLEGCQVWNQVS